MDGDEFHAAVYHVVRQIPPQRVTSYGHVAKLLGMPTYSRHVGQALKFVSPDVVPPIPWYRVLSSSGTISSRGPGTSGANRQRDALVAEGVDVQTARSGEFKVGLRQYGWFPAVGSVDIGVQQPAGGDGAGADEAYRGGEP
ncbi:DNA binding methylated-DNA-cysteine S-methyltransferase [Lenzites betulinus]|nr:DNA binding methylated-DNA-cysteine S-methyltransferase [Lenzites betulinus]